MKNIYPIFDEDWLEKNKAFLNISCETYNKIKELNKFIESKDWESKRVKNDTELIEKINKLELISEYTTISVVYIVKNERDYIIKSLLSILDLADEIIIVDTGSEDNTLDLIKKMCDKKIKIFTFNWCDDFSKARNFANAKATCDWIMILDADEIVRKNDNLKFYLTYLRIFDDFENTAFNFKVIRDEEVYKTSKLIRNTNTLTYKGRVHETFFSLNNSVSYANLNVEVLGIRRGSQKKTNYYNKLLLKTIIDFPKKGRWYYLYLRDNIEDINYNKMLKFCKKIIFKRDAISGIEINNNYYSVRIIFLLMFKLLEESNHERFTYYMELLEKDFNHTQDFIFLKYSYYIKKLNIDATNLLKSFLENYDLLNEGDVIFSKECTHSLLGASLFWGGYLKESKKVFEELEINSKDTVCFYNKKFIYDCLSTLS
ncbi:glycosyltransferase [Staphylococcus pseudintermedius]|uniref:glycosyltransferase n=1 Tax=Staphylococcus pseudintermedius TaxID=283734 RepID=UPI001123C797|nr:glycosyltransferase [Staphylococcus pseudintermedius]EGQ3406624.1 glycosyltransferase [Staphylococcus pseudintermedius]EGQ3808682.1 glycosyltransferase [Staphylococcus pseudintermedius]EHT3644232.1 glycosyltransferase [Staphylococcus pseudintermedius]EIE3739650.1 glycosyltransferase [Staphylococcus pseudintermedius]EIQ3888340.1 glycosyltransferase [Staphylococcus pseudintermedius]